MTVVQLGKNPLHRGFSEYAGAFFHTEALTILLDSGHFLVVQVNDLPVSTPQRCLAHFEILRIRNCRILFFSCQNRLPLDKTNRKESRGQAHRPLPEAFRFAKISIFNQKNDLRADFNVIDAIILP